MKDIELRHAYKLLLQLKIEVQAREFEQKKDQEEAKKVRERIRSRAQKIGELKKQLWECIK